MHTYTDPITGKKKSLNYSNQKKHKRKFRKLCQMTDDRDRGYSFFLSPYFFDERGGKTYPRFKPGHTERTNPDVKRRIKRSARRQIKKMDSFGSQKGNYRKMADLWWELY